MRGQAAVALISVVAMALATPAAARAASPHRCECVEFVKSYFGLRGAAGNAKDMGPYLAAHGFKRLSRPVVGAVVILQPGYYRHGEGSVYGHAGIVTAVTRLDSRHWSLRVRSANQLARPQAALGCNNVSLKWFGPLATDSRLVSYWLPPR
ncbi:MAG TPA: CHAP domain-containing protein [Dehalococcoidia bacterium]|nr:CHAP domain-containing protein [Dehalococcoidia bacterium]